jgi:response regulator RpfG family c-di-GMP phosphodiesterase
MTAHALEGDREKCLEAGMDEYISKPVRSQALSQVIEKIFAKENESQKNNHLVFQETLSAVELTDLQQVKI